MLLETKVQDAAKACLNRLYKEFPKADHPDWHKVIERARKGDGDALAIDGFGHAQCVFELHSGDKARAETCSEPGVLAESAQAAIVRECNEGGTKHLHYLSLIQSATVRTQFADRPVSHTGVGGR